MMASSDPPLEICNQEDVEEASFEIQSLAIALMGISELSDVPD